MTQGERGGHVPFNYAEKGTGGEAGREGQDCVLWKKDKEPRGRTFRVTVRNLDGYECPATFNHIWVRNERKN